MTEGPRKTGTDSGDGSYAAPNPDRAAEVIGEILDHAPGHIPTGARRRRLSALTARDLLARHMFIADELRKASDPVAGIQAVEEWDDDRLLSDTYKRFKQMATDAIYAAMQAKEDDERAD